MHRYNRKKHKMLYIRQGIISLLLLAVTIYLGISASLTQSLFSPVIKDLSVLSSAEYCERHPIIQLRCDTLYYTGYDNYLKDNVTGHYYYAIQNHCCILVLLDTTESTPKDAITNFKGTVKLIDDADTFHNLTQNLAKDMDWSSRSLQGITLSVIASQPDYHPVLTALFTAGLLACLIVFGYGTISNFYYYLRYF